MGISFMSSRLAHLFGQFELVEGGVSCALPASSNARLVLAYLLLHRGEGCSRTVLAELIAPELPETQALHALSQALWHIRRALPGWLDSDAFQVSFAANIQISTDAKEFAALLEPHLSGCGQASATLRDLKRAVEFYRGDLLEGYYQDWVLLERERLREQYLQALEMLVTAYKSTLQYQQALAAALHWAGTDPLSESAHREVMRLYHYLGCPAEALRQYEKCREILRQEFDLEPEPETDQIARAIRQRSQNTLAPHLPEPHLAPGFALFGDLSRSMLPLIGRRLERASLANWLQPGKAGNASLILVEGEAGVGKTRLLQEVARDVEWYGAQVLWGEATPFADRPPLEALVTALNGGLKPLRVEQLQHLVEALWLQALEPLFPQLIQNIPGLAPFPELESHEAKVRLQEGLARLLAAWATLVPLVIIIEDIHWIDVDTLDTLVNLAFRLCDTKVAFVLSFRREDLAGRPEIQAKLLALRPEMVRGRLALTSLEAEAIHELVQASLGLGEISAAFKGLLHHKTNGNPLFILEVLRGLYDEGVLRQNPEGSWVTPFDLDVGDGDLPLPPAVEQVISHRLEQLPPRLRQMLEALSVLGDEFDFNQIACLGLPDMPALVGMLQELTQRRLILETSQGYRFAHDKIRQAVHEGLSKTQRTLWHRQLAAALEQAYPHLVESLALHFTEGEVWRNACVYQKLAAEKARQALAYTGACDHITQAILAAGQAGLPASEIFDLLRFREEILEVLGRRQEQGQDLEQMARLGQADPCRWSDALRRQANWLCSVNRFDAAEAAARQSMELAQQIGDENAQIAARFTLGAILHEFYTNRFDEATDCFLAAAEYYHRTQNWKHAAEVHGWLAKCESLNLPGTTHIEEARQALALAQQSGDKALQADLYCLWASIHQMNGSEQALVVQAYQNALEIACTIGYRLVEARTFNNLANLCVIQTPDQALSYYDQAAAIFQVIGDERRAAIVRLNAALNRALLLGDVAASNQAAETALAYAATAGDGWVRGLAWLVMGIAAWRKSDLETAHRLLEDAASTFKAIGNHVLLVQTALIQTYVELDLDMPEEAIATSQIAEALARQTAWLPAQVMAQAARATAYLRLHRLEDADRLSAEALQGLPPIIDRPWVIHFARYQALAAQYRHEEAHQALESAYRALKQTFDQLTPEHRLMSSQQVPEHRLILETWQAARPRQVPVQLVRANVPLGRPPRENEWVSVNWTIATSEDENFPGKVKRRQQRILRLLQEAYAAGAAATNENLAEALEVSSRTIAADIAVLERKHAGLLQASMRGRISVKLEA